MNQLGDNEFYYVDYGNLDSLYLDSDPNDSNTQYGEWQDIYDGDLYKFIPIQSPDTDSLPLHEKYYKTDFLSSYSESPVLPPVQEVFYPDYDHPQQDYSQSQRDKKSLFTPPVNQNTPPSDLGHIRRFRQIFSPSLQIQVIGGQYFFKYLTQISSRNQNGNHFYILSHIYCK